MWSIIDKLADIILTHVPGAIVEIGVGKSTEMLAKHAQAHNVKLYSCDIKPFRHRFNDHICFIGTSFDFMDQYFKETFDDHPAIVFLDGCHNADILRKEVELFLPLMLNGGVIFIHDTLPPTKKHLRKDRCSDAYLVRKELENRSDVNCFTWLYTANNCGLTMVQQQPKCVVDFL